MIYRTFSYLRWGKAKLYLLMDILNHLFSRSYEEMTNRHYISGVKGLVNKY